MKTFFPILENVVSLSYPWENILTLWQYSIIHYDIKLLMMYTEETFKTRY
jgi:hypothetical protein